MSVLLFTEHLVEVVHGKASCKVWRTGYLRLGRSRELGAGGAGARRGRCGEGQVQGRCGEGQVGEGRVSGGALAVGRLAEV